MRIAEHTSIDDKQISIIRQTETKWMAMLWARFFDFSTFRFAICAFSQSNRIRERVFKNPTDWPRIYIYLVKLSYIYLEYKNDVASEPFWNAFWEQL